MELEWDEEKRQRTLQERGLDFADVVRFEFGSAITIPDTRRDYGEPRFNSLGRLDGNLCNICWTLRNGAFRVISLRKCNDRERKKYEVAKVADA
ncbi:BrnT family toxin [Nitratireductor soli]|uniref:BrnT family toxin n=1 Tax=Nitratireductor soli TaxID=1670619 RepID=UPI00065E30A4|nr:BrnT family toxin [Nitratireductor soli]